MGSTKRRRNYKSLLQKDANLRRWYDNLKRSSPLTADVSLRRIGRACAECKTSPAKLAEMSVKEATDFIMDWVTRLDSEGKQPSYMENNVNILKSWFAHNGKKITESIKLPDPTTPSKVQQEQSPTPDQFNRVLDVADPKQKVESTLIGFAGLRPESVGDYLGTDGMKLADLPELEVDNAAKQVTFKKVPTMMVVRKNLSKARHQYFTFYPEQSCNYLKALLELRMLRGEILTPESPVVNSLKWQMSIMKKGKPQKHIATRRVSKSIKTAIEEAGFDWRPYILRTYFDTRLMMAEADSIIIRDWRVFWMGHSGDIEHRYTLNKGKLPDDLLEKMRKAFAKAADQYLVTTGKRASEVKDMETAKQFRIMMELLGATEEELEKLGDLTKLDTSTMADILEKRQKSRLGLNGNKQKVVPMDEVENYILQGWEFVKELPPNKAIIKLPN